MSHKNNLYPRSKRRLTIWVLVVLLHVVGIVWLLTDYYQRHVSTPQSGIVPVSEVHNAPSTLPPEVLSTPADTMTVDSSMTNTPLTTPNHDVAPMSAPAHSTPDTDVRRSPKQRVTELDAQGTQVRRTHVDAQKSEAVPTEPLAAKRSSAKPVLNERPMPNAQSRVAKAAPNKPPSVVNPASNPDSALVKNPRVNDVWSLDNPTGGAFDAVGINTGVTRYRTRLTRVGVSESQPIWRGDTLLSVQFLGNERYQLDLSNDASSKKGEGNIGFHSSLQNSEQGFIPSKISGGFNFKLSVDEQISTQEIGLGSQLYADNDMSAVWAWGKKPINNHAHTVIFLDRVSLLVYLQGWLRKHPKERMPMQLILPVATTSGVQSNTIQLSLQNTDDCHACIVAQAQGAVGELNQWQAAFSTKNNYAPTTVQWLVGRGNTQWQVYLERVP